MRLEFTFFLHDSGKILSSALTQLTEPVFLIDATCFYKAFSKYFDTVKKEKNPIFILQKTMEQLCDALKKKDPPMLSVSLNLRVFSEKVLLISARQEVLAVTTISTVVMMISNVGWKWCLLCGIDSTDRNSTSAPFIRRQHDHESLNWRQKIQPRKGSY